MSQTITSEKAFVRAVRFKVGNGACVGQIEFAARMTPKIAEALECRYTVYDNKDLPKSFKAVELEQEWRNCALKLDVGGVGHYHLGFESPLVHKFKVVRIGGKKKAKSTYLVMRFEAQASAQHAKLIVDYLITAGAAEGVLVVDRKPEPVQQTLTAEITKDTAAKVVEMMARAQESHSEVERLEKMAAEASAQWQADREPERVSYEARMEQAATADEGRQIISELEVAIHTLAEAAGVEPICGPQPDGYRGFSTVTAKEWRAYIKVVKEKDAKLADILIQTTGRRESAAIHR